MIVKRDESSTRSVGPKVDGQGCLPDAMRTVIFIRDMGQVASHIQCDITKRAITRTLGERKRAPGVPLTLAGLLRVS